MDTEAILNNGSRSDTELMEAVGRRESDAIQGIYERYESTLRTVIQSVLHDDGEIDDGVCFKPWMIRTSPVSDPPSITHRTLEPYETARDCLTACHS